VDGSDRGSGEMSITKGSRGSVDMVGVSHDSGGNGLPDDGLSLDSDWDVDIVRGINMDGGWDLHNLLGVEGGIIRGINLALNKDRALDIVDLSLGLDNGGVDSLGSPEDGWDSDRKMRSGWLVDLGGVSGHIAGLSKVHLLGDHRGGLVDGGHASSLCGGGVRGRGSGLGICHGGMGNHGASRVVLGTVGGSSNGGYSGKTIAKTMHPSKTKSSISASHGNISRSAIGAAHHKGKCHKRSHSARYLH